MPVVGVRRNDSHQVAYVHASSRRRIVRGKVRSPYYVPVSEPVCSAKLKTRGFAMET